MPAMFRPLGCRPNCRRRRTRQVVRSQSVIARHPRRLHGCRPSCPPRSPRRFRQRSPKASRGCRRPTRRAICRRPCRRKRTTPKYSRRKAQAAIGRTSAGRADGKHRRRANHHQHRQPGGRAGSRLCVAVVGRLPKLLLPAPRRPDVLAGILLVVVGVADHKNLLSFLRRVVATISRLHGCRPSCRPRTPRR